MIKELLEGVINQEELLNYYNVSITYVDGMPILIRGFVYHYKGVYSIFINSNLSYYKKKKTLLHELAHIELNHLCQNNKDLFEFFIDTYEDEADEYIKKIKESVGDNY